MLIEELTVMYLSGRMPVRVSGSVPSPMPERFITVARTGGSETNHIRAATIAVKCWSGISKDDAARLCDNAEKAMKEFISLPEISRCSLNSSYENTDEKTKRWRYQAVFDIVYSIQEE